jgi:hypothetical protein
MEHLVFILWICLWPLTLTLCEYIDLKRDMLLGKQHKERKIDFGVIWWIGVIWIIVAGLVY